MAFNISRLKGGRPVTDNGDAEERHFVVDPDFDKEDGMIVVPTTGSSDTLYFTNALINNSRTITSFSIVDGSQTSFTSSGGSFTVRIEGEEGARFTLTQGGGASVENSLMTIGSDGFIEEVVTVTSTTSTSNRSPFVTVNPDISETPETLLGDGVGNTVSVSQTGVALTPAVFSITGVATNNTTGFSTTVFPSDEASTSASSGTQLNIPMTAGDTVSFSYTVTLVTGGNMPAVATLSGLYVFPQLGPADSYTWNLTQSPGASILSAGPESGTNRPSGKHLREGVSREGQSFTWSATVDTSEWNLPYGGFDRVVLYGGAGSKRLWVNFNL